MTVAVLFLSRVPWPQLGCITPHSTTLSTFPLPSAGISGGRGCLPGGATQTSVPEGPGALVALGLGRK